MDCLISFWMLFILVVYQSTTVNSFCCKPKYLSVKCNKKKNNFKKITMFLLYEVLFINYGTSMNKFMFQTQFYTLSIRNVQKYSLNVLITPFHFSSLEKDVYYTLNYANFMKEIACHLSF